MTERAGKRGGRIEEKNAAGRLALKGADRALLVFLLALSFLPLALLGEPSGDVYAEVTLRGDLHRRVRLTGHRGTERFAVETESGRNVIELRDESIAVVEADCPDGICVQAGWLSRPGETAACLPHGLLLEVRGDGGRPSPDDVIMVR